MNTLFEILPLLVPVLLTDVVLLILGVMHILKHPHYRFGNKSMWLVISVIFLLFGPMIYFIFGKGENE